MANDDEIEKLLKGLKYVWADFGVIEKKLKDIKKDNHGAKLSISNPEVYRDVHRKLEIIKESVKVYLANLLDLKKASKGRDTESLVNNLGFLKIKVDDELKNL
ncbi:MAG: hypothetical protein PHD81_01985 [Candidatus Nanoarchaeia archaeon]|nr:hypothetical protein [Candidatus Nanoarchaeia archaeon]MDD5587859.1 hypothetical protein [Candidatus Nanoarchaeia archaeon]